MASNQHYLFFSLLFLFIASTYSTPFLSDEALKVGLSSGRSLLEGKKLKQCPINMKVQNYSILTNKCKGPKYSAPVCCDALLEFCCPFADQLNDMSNNCAIMMFIYIDQHGHYPPGYFADHCREGPKGLSCDRALKN